MVSTITPTKNKIGNASFAKRISPPTYKIVHDMAPGYLSELVEMEISTDSYNTRTKPDADNLRMKLPKVYKNKASDRRFSVHAPETWNSLPYNIRSINNVESFKKHLKTYLFNSMVR